ncbi:hypothetical protein GCM10010844_41430 [Deinococcus radiotolerans]|uniref:Uncharacterized protein n=1 Tax=Deinococcus radiotolerans TaxID=1309407 RepID=A0ABQ2FQY5_9DEIO|nr:hypothetical protein GCM10010844_41430 [Deinococcus radiotolerans]
MAVACSALAGLSAVAGEWLLLHTWSQALAQGGSVHLGSLNLVSVDYYVFNGTLNHRQAPSPYLLSTLLLVLSFIAAVWRPSQSPRRLEHS